MVFDDYDLPDPACLRQQIGSTRRVMKDIDKHHYIPGLVGKREFAAVKLLYRYGRHRTYRHIESLNADVWPALQQNRVQCAVSRPNIQYPRPHRNH